MEFFYEEQVAANDEPTAEHPDEKTVEAFNKLEDEVNQGYERTTKALKSIVQEGEEGIKINLPLDPEVSEKAQQYLQRLDSNLHSVEAMAQSYWTQVSKPGFWSSMTERLGGRLDQVVNLGDGSSLETTTKTKSPQTAVGGNRTEAELRSLSSNKSLYLDFKGALGTFDIDAKTNEIAKILEQDTELANLMNEIVPQEVSYQNFWTIFFSEKQRILDMEDQRKKILQSNIRSNEEEVSWDDVEDDEDEEEPVIVKKEDTINVEKIPNKVEISSNNEGKSQKEETTEEAAEEDEDEDDDDDWE